LIPHSAIAGIVHMKPRHRSTDSQTFQFQKYSHHSVAMNGKTIALLTDFGWKDGYTGIMKAVILSIAPGLPIIDLSHDIDPQNLYSGAYVLYSAWDHFPNGSTFCAVVDPGVGGDRGALLAEITGRTLIAPDNGLISVVLRMNPNSPVFELREEEVRSRRAGALARAGMSSTFHGRDLFAPAAALCALGAKEQIRGRRIEPVFLPAVIPRRGDHGISGAILHIDRFGNCISSIHQNDLDILRDTAGGVSIRAGEFQRREIDRTYSDVHPGTALCLIGSSGFLEIAVCRGNAAERFGLCAGQTVTITAGDA